MPTRELHTTPQSRLEALRKKHALLSLQVEEGHRNPSTCDFYLKQLKKHKLMIKQKMHETARGAAQA